MGRAIDMEKDIQMLKRRTDRIEAALSKVIDVLDSMEEKGQRTTHVDLVEDVQDDNFDPNEIGVEATKMMEEGADNHVKEKTKKKKSNEKAKRPKKD